MPAVAAVVHFEVACDYPVLGRIDVKKTNIMMPIAFRALVSSGNCGRLGTRDREGRERPPKAEQLSEAVVKTEPPAEVEGRNSRGGLPFTSNRILRGGRLMLPSEKSSNQ
jgi:hypothetical protein